MPDQLVGYMMYKEIKPIKREDGDSDMGSEQMDEVEGIGFGDGNSARGGSKAIRPDATGGSEAFGMMGATTPNPNPVDDSFK